MTLIDHKASKMIIKTRKNVEQLFNDYILITLE